MNKFMLMERRQVVGQRYRPPRATQVRACLVLSALILFGFANSTARSQEPSNDWYMASATDAADLGLSHPVGLSYSPAANVFMVLGEPEPGFPQTLITFTPFADPAGSNLLATPVADPLNVAFVPASETLLALEPGGMMTQLLIGNRALRGPEGQNTHRAAVAGLRLNRPVGVTIDTTGNRLFALDAAGPYLVEVRADRPDVEASLAAGTARIRLFRLGSLGDATPSGLAYNPATGRLYTAAADGRTLFEFSERGRVVNRYDLSEIGLVDPRGMVVAPSADPTDDPAVMNLYLADSGGEQNLGRIIEISFVRQVEMPTALAAASLVNVIDTSKAAWNPSSPDPAGLAYRPSVNRLLISDSEVEESHPDYQGYNVFESTVGGSLTSFCTTVSFSNEPTGAAVNPVNNHIFFTDDNANRVYEIDLVDGIYCNGNDIVTNINVLSLFGIDDAEGAAYGNNTVFIAGGVTTQVYRIGLGANGVVGGGDDSLLGQFDTQASGIRDPEGIEYNPDTGTLFISSAVLSDEFILEVSTTGTVINNYDLSVVGREPRSGLALAPASDGSNEMHLYIASRGVDNGADPDENDGKIYEIDLGGGPVNTPTPTPVNTNTPTNTPVNTNTPTNTPVNTNTPTPTPVNTNTPTRTPTATPVNTNTPTATPVNTSTPTATFVAPTSGALLISLLEAGPTTVGNLTGISDEDIISYDGSSWSMVFDGSDVGVGSEIDAFHMLDADTLLLSLAADRSVPNLGAVDDSDIIRFDTTSLGANTAGTFSRYFEGSDVGLTTPAEDIDALRVLPDGRIIISTRGGVTVPGLSAADEDLLAFTPTSLGATTTGSWTLYFDGSDVGLTSSEGVDGAAVAANGDIYLSTAGGFSVPGLSGADEDVFICKPTSLGNNTACNYVATLAFDGSIWGLDSNDVDGVDLP